MEMQSRHRSKRGAIEVQEPEGEDRLSRLPDDILHSILRGLPLKHAARTSALSRRWARTWLRALASSRVLDFTDRDFGRGQARAAAATVSCCLRFHAERCAALDVFRVALTSPVPGTGAAAFERDVGAWVASAVARGAREVEVDLRPPPTKRGAVDESAAFVELLGDLFVATNSLARLALGGFSLRTVPAGAAGLAGLRSLSLSHADVTGEAVRGVVSSCRALEFLSLSSCNLLKSVRIASGTLRVLEIVRCPAVRELRVNAPALESFAFHGDTVYSSDYDDLSSAVDLGSTPALRQAYLSHIGFDDDVNAYQDREYAYSNFLSCVAHARALTLCSVGLLLGYDECVDIDMTNIQELQLLLSSEGEDDDLQSFASFFQINPFPLLDRLFVSLPSHTTDASDAAAALAGEVVNDSRMMIPGYAIVPVDDSRMMIQHFDFVLDHLSFIKLVNFRGTRFQLQLLAFLLKRAPALEQLVLVTVGEEGGAPVDEHVIQGWVSGMRKASAEAQLIVCRSSEDRSQYPVHTRFYHELEE
ncbi:putative F-box/LRR-repeat protein At4g15060 isoform X2 [Miscanthus floridulus]|uniref:putative F-box/LRR-repeat protein At4g15060 isoform X2 n=1 Tax=Miscanthus floridulus TaxID=154761 RepID=UPI00345763D1